MAIALTDIVRVTVKGIMSNQMIQNVLHYRPVTVNQNFAATAQQCLTAFESMWKAAILPIVSAQYGVGQYDLVAIKGTEQIPPVEGEIKILYGDSAFVIPATGNFGAVITPPLPTYAAATIQKRTGRVGRKFRGSMRLGGILEEDTSTTVPNELTVNARNAVQGAANTLMAPLPAGVVGDTLELVVFRNAEILAQPLPVTNAAQYGQRVTSVPVNRFVGTQISRKQRFVMGT